MKVDAGSHNRLFKIGMKLYKVSPSLYDSSIKVLSFPDTIKRRMSSKPVEIGGKIGLVNLELTILCNLRCTMCWWWGEQGIAFDLVEKKDPLVTQQLTTQEIFNAVDQIAKDKPTFYLSGGEPFERRDTIDIIEYIASKGMSVVTNSNGTMLSDTQLERLAKIKRLTINFSIDGTREVHDRIRGNGMYDKTLSTIKRLVEYRGKNSYPSTKTNTTFSPWIVGKMDELIRDLQETGIDGIRMQHLWFTDEETAKRHREALKEIFGIDDVGVNSHVIGRPTETYVKRLADEIIEIEKRKYEIPVMIHPRMSREDIVRYYMDLSFSKVNKCYAGQNNLLIKANGDVMFCPDEWMTKFKIGNTRIDSVNDMWNNNAAKKFRTELDKRGLFPACKRCCFINS